MNSNLSPIEYIPERSEATPGLWNQRYSVISANIAAIDSNATINLSGATLSIGSSVSIGRDLWVKGSITVGVEPSAATRTAVNIGVRSDISDYLYFTDEAALRSNYILGSHVGGTADGLNIWDASGSTMIASFSKQSIRFYQNVVGPVFDVGGALADTLNAATFGTGADSTESRIQSAINQASIDGISRVYVPANMYPYSASSMSFIYSVQMVREGGDWGVYDIQAYGARGDGTGSQSSAVQEAFHSAAFNRSVAFIPQGRFRILNRIGLPSNLEVDGAGHNAILYFAWFHASGTTSGGDVYLVNSGSTIGSSNTAIRLHDFAIEGDNTTGLPTGSPVPGPASGVLLRRGSDVDIARMRISNVPSISISYQGISNARFLNNYVLGGGHDGITGGSFGTWPCSDVVVANNVIGPVGDDGLAVNVSVDQGTPGTVRPARISLVGNTIFGEITNNTGAAGRGIVLNGVEYLTAVGNSIGSTFADGILLENDTVTGFRSQFVTLTGNVISGAGLTGDGTQSPTGIEVAGTDWAVISSNIISRASSAGIAVSSSQYIGIVGNSIISNGKSILAFGVDCSGSTNTHITIANNMVQGNAGAGVFVNLGQGVFIRDNVIVDNGSIGTGALVFGSGILVQSGGGVGQSPTVEITGNYITDTRAAANKTQTYGIRGTSVSGGTFVITHNYLSSNSSLGISITGTPNSLQQYANANLETTALNVIGWWSPSAFTNGTALLPGMSFASEVSLGWYRSAVSEMALSYGTLLLTDVLVRARANSGTLPQYRFWSGSAQHFQMSLGRASNEMFFYVPNTNGAFLTGTRIGDSAIAGNSGTTLHLATGAGVPHLSLGTNSGVNVTYFNQTRVASLRTLAASSLTPSAANTNVLKDEMVFTVGGASGASLAIHSGGTVYIFDSTSSAKAT